MNNQFQTNLIDSPISIDRLKELAKQNYGEMIKGVVDLEKKILALGGEMHADAEQFLLESGSKQQNVWGFNLYPSESDLNNFIEYHSLINIRPNQGNRSMFIEIEEIREKVKEIILNLINRDDQQNSPDTYSGKI
ncbi:MAG: hypothetical protein ACD_83C00266G0002 [uncultured bacterium]|uniref:Uncharacterized protein n=1 Tax=Berkelbacteria bacterium GW2011_GWA2_38_9 TaxID=1618334 RepID=A0A0G0PMH1_9BACT|nr:MAG: hypothetical protein ACD_83C00266G0002 [uncultured bacterium]KKQ90511.1 MAG: hypothetical protein UT11_C0004G0013 [Berkelbacteria bacterium GW2011_GWA2_38_9]